jgi:glycosyltransferase involved in cell wall biosynthesis
VSNRPEVLHVVAPMREGGLERVVTMMTMAQPEKSVHVAAVLEPGSGDHHPFMDQLQGLGVPVTRISVGARDYLREYRLLSALVKQLRPSVVHTHGYRSDVIGGAVARAHRVLTVSTVHGFTGGGSRNRIYEWVQSIALRRADAVIAVSAPLAERLRADGIDPHKIHCVLNGFVPIVDAAPRAEARRLLGIKSDALVVGWVGRLSREKGADIMLEALAAADPKWQLSSVGTGDQLENLRQQAERLQIPDRITWHGAIPNAGSLITAFDAFVLSSRTEGTPITLFEAMHAGVPIVSTRVGGIPDVVNESQAILVPSNAPELIARALAAVVGEPSAATARSVLARQRLLESFGSARWLARVGAVYEAARARGRGRTGER